MNTSDLVRAYLVDPEDGMKNVIAEFLNEVMEVEAAEQIGANRYERTDKRKDYRNGFKPKSLKTRYGEIELRKPQFRDHSFESKVFSNYARIEKAIVLAILESYLQGVSTRKIMNVVAPLGLEGISASTVSRLGKELDDLVEEFLKRPIEVPVHYLYIDASYFKVRSGGQY